MSDSGFSRLPGVVSFGLSLLGCILCAVLPGVPLKFLGGALGWVPGLVFAIRAIRTEVSGIERVFLAMSLVMLVCVGGFFALALVLKLVGGVKPSPFF